MKNRRLLFVSLLVASTMTFTSCEPELDEPPVNEIPIGGIKTIGDLAQIYADSGTYKFTEDFSVYATVTADKIGGNFYKSVFIEDSTSALNMRTLQNGGMYIGDVVRVNLKGATISRYAELLQLDSVDVDTRVVIQANGQFVEPRVITMDEVFTNPDNMGRVVRFDNVEFVDGDLGATYATPNGTSAVNRYIQDCDGNELILRNSDFSTFAGSTVPTRNGSITAILSRFNDDIQLLLRREAEVDFTELRCDGSTGEYLIFKNFQDQSLTSGGWSQFVVEGSDEWYVDEFDGSNYFLKASNFNGSTNDPSEVWMISPAIDLTTITNPGLSFVTMCNYDGPVLQTFVSTDYVNADPSDATWTELTANYSPGNWDVVSSGPVDLSAYSSAATRIAFRYTGGSSDGKTWELDNIAVFGN